MTTSSMFETNPPTSKPPDLTNGDVTQPGREPPAVSYASAASKSRFVPRFQPVELPSRQYSVIDGKPAVHFSTAEFEAGAALFRHSLVAKFTMGRPSIEEIRKVFKENWVIKGRATVSDIWDSRHLMIILDSEEDAKVALTSPLRKVGHAMFRLFRYTPDYNPKRESATTTKWVRLPDIHPAFVTKNFVAGIVNSFGYFLDLDERSKACSTLKFARACVEIDVRNPIPNAVRISLSDGRIFWQKIEVEGRLSYCDHCKIHGHTLAECRKKNPALNANHAVIVNVSRTSIVGETRTIDVTTQNGPAINGNKSSSSKEQGEWVEVRKRKGNKIVRFSDKDSSKNLAPNSISMESVDGGDKLDISNDHLGEPINSGDGSPIAAGANLPVQTLGAKLPFLELPDPGMTSVGQSAKENENISHSGNNENEVVDIPQCGNKENEVTNVKCTEVTMASNEEMQSSALHLDDGTSEDSAAKYSKVPVTADKDKQVIRSQFLDDYIKWAKVNGEFEDFLVYCKEQGLTHTYGSSITIEDSKRVDEDRSTTHNSEDEVCNQDDDSIRKPIPAKNRHRKNKGSRSSTRSCPKQKDKNFVYP